MKTNREYIVELLHSDCIKSWKDLYEEIALSGVSNTHVVEMMRTIMLNDTAQSAFKSKFKNL